MMKQVLFSPLNWLKFYSVRKMSDKLPHSGAIAESPGVFRTREQILEEIYIRKRNLENIQKMADKIRKQINELEHEVDVGMNIENIERHKILGTRLDKKV